MNRLETAVQRDLSDAPEAPPVAAIERRAQRRRARELAAGCGAGVAVVALAVAGFLWTRPTTPVEVRTTSPSSASSSTDTTVPGLPLATRAIFPGLDSVLRRVAGSARADGPVATAEIVETTHDKTFALFGGRPDDHRATYLVKLEGRFVCEECSGPAGHSAPRGNRIYFTVTRAPGALDDPWEIGSRDIDLSAFGRVYRLPPAVATARLELGRTALRTGESLPARIVVENDTGRPIRFPGCGGPYQVVLENARYQPQIAWLSCLTTIVIPMGTTTYSTEVFARASVCSGAPDSCALPPGNYRASVATQDPAAPRAPSVAVRVTR